MLIQSPGEDQVGMPIQRPPAQVEIFGVELGHMSRERIEVFDLGAFQIVKMDPRDRCMPEGDDQNGAQSDAAIGPNRAAAGVAFWRGRFASIKPPLYQLYHTPGFQAGSIFHQYGLAGQNRIPCGGYVMYADDLGPLQSHGH